MKTVRSLGLTLGVLGAMIAGPAAAGDIEAGKAKSIPCRTCHGKDGIGTMPHFPNLAGQKSLYMVQQLNAFRKGTRQSEVMGIIAGNLSDQDIEDLAAYFESLSPGGSGG